VDGHHAGPDLVGVLACPSELRVKPLPLEAEAPEPPHWQSPEEQQQRLICDCQPVHWTAGLATRMGRILLVMMMAAGIQTHWRRGQQAEIR